MRIRWNGATATTRTVSGQVPTGVTANVSGNAQIGRTGNVLVQLTADRGEVQVLQQPTARSDYTAVVRITDGPRGNAHYDFDLTWQ